MSDCTTPKDLARIEKLEKDMAAVVGMINFLRTAQANTNKALIAVLQDKAKKSGLVLPFDRNGN